MKLALLTMICLSSGALADGLVTEGNLHPRRIHDVTYYDDSFCFVVRGYGDNRDNIKTIEPGLFVHSKAHNKWIEIKKIPTKGGRFGRNAMQDPKLMTASVTWDHTPLRTEALAEMPLRTSGSICLPETIFYDAETETFELGFLTSWKDIPDASTYLYIKRADLIEAFIKQK